jgi:hypothetical protein
LKKIAIIAPFCSLPGEPKFNRFRYIAEMLKDKYEVTLVTSRFRHYDKTFRYIDYNMETGYKIVLLNEKGYKNNFSIRRALSHVSFVSAFKEWFEPSKYDVIYSAYPLIGTNLLLGELKPQGDYKLIIDIQDIWPEAISGAIPLLKFLPDIINPFYHRANKAYRYADYFIAVSETYLSRALSCCKNTAGSVLYIGTDFSLIPDEVGSFDDNRIHFVYFGAVGPSYDLSTVIKSFNQLDQAKYILHIFGGGDGEDKLKSIAEMNTIFHGFVPVNEMLSFAKKANVLLNPISSNAKQSVTNKLSDIISLKLPVITSQKTPEVRRLLSRECDFDYDAGSITSFLGAVHRFEISHLDVKAITNDLRFDRNVAYKELLTYLDKLDV